MGGASNGYSLHPFLMCGQHYYFFPVGKGGLSAQNSFQIKNNKIKMMSVNDIQSVYGGEAAIDGGTLPEVTVTASKDKFYNHLTALMLNGNSMEAIYLFLGHYSTKANIQ